jgi:hypothetical protein
VDYLQHCPNCGWPIEPNDKFCRNCGKPFEERVEQTPPSPPPPVPPTPPVPPDSMLPPVPPEEPKYVPWEDRQKVGFLNGLWKTWVESVFYPDRFFSKLPFKGGLGAPILYALIIAWAGSIIYSIYQVIFTNVWMGIMRSFLDKMGSGFNLPSGMGESIGILVFLRSLIIAPIGIILGIFIISGILHLICMIFGWAKRDFEATLRAVTYSAGPAIFAIIPMCGSPIGMVWGLVLTIIGLKHMQQTTGGKAAVVVLLPIIFCCCLIIIAAIIFGAAILAFVKGAVQSGGGYNY